MSKTAVENMRSKEAETVKVVVRCRPLSTKEMQDGHDVCVKVPKGRNDIFIDRPDASEAPK